MKVTDQIRWVAMRVAMSALLVAMPAAQASTPGAKPVTVTVSNFVRAESDLYFGRYVKRGAFGKFFHERSMTPIDKQEIVRMNRDTLYSFAIFDLDASPVTITLPDPGKRFMSMQVISEDHYTIDVVYAPGRHTYTKDSVGSRYVFLGVRTLANPEDLGDLKAAHALQDRRTHHFLETMKPDIFLGAHAEWFGYAAKRDRAKTAGVQAWVNPEEYRQFIAKQEREFEDQVDLELGVKT